MEDLHLLSFASLSWRTLGRVMTCRSDGGSRTAEVPLIADERAEARERQGSALRHEHRRSTRRCATVREMKEGPSGSVIRSPIPSHRELLRPKAVVVSVAETSGR